jgi:hypothetical protein
MTENDAAGAPSKSLKDQLLSSGKIVPIAIGALVVLVAGWAGLSVMGSGERAAEAEDEIDRILRRAELDDIIDYDRITAPAFGAGVVLHEIELEYDDTAIGTIDQLRIRRFDVRDEIITRIQLEAVGVREEVGYTIAGGKAALTSMVARTRLIPFEIANAIQPGAAGRFTLDWRYDPRSETASLAWTRSVPGFGALDFEINFENVAERGLQEIWDAYDEIGERNGAGLVVGDLGSLLFSQDILEEFEDLEVASARYTLRDDGYLAAVSEIIAYRRDFTDGDFDLAGNLFDPDQTDDSNVADRLEEMEDALDTDNFEALQNALTPGGRLVIRTDFSRPMEVFDSRNGRIRLSEDIMDFAELIEDGDLVFEND